MTVPTKDRTGRNFLIALKVSAEEKAAIEEAAGTRGLDVSAFLRLAIDELAGTTMTEAETPAPSKCSNAHCRREVKRVFGPDGICWKCYRNDDTRREG